MTKNEKNHILTKFNILVDLGPKHREICSEKMRKRLTMRLLSLASPPFLILELEEVEEEVMVLSLVVR